MTQRKILIVGAAGYVGSVLTGRLLSSGYRVRGFDLLLFHNQTAVLPYLDDPAYEFRRGDLAKADDVIAALDGITDVVLLGGLVGDPITRKYPRESRLINHDGYLSLLGALNGRGLDRVIFVSTCSNYGMIGDGETADEDFVLKPLSAYAEAKVAVEELLLGARDEIDYTPTVLRFATAFGLSPRMRFDLTIGEFTRDMYLGKELLVYDADTWRPYCHLGDFAEAIRLTLEAPRDDVAFEVFNAGGDANNFTKKMIVETIREFLPDANIRYQEKGPDPRNYRVDFAKIRQRLAFEPKVAVGDGIAELIAALDQGLFHDIDTPTSFFGNYELSY